MRRPPSPCAPSAPCSARSTAPAAPPSAPSAGSTATPCTSRAKSCRPTAAIAIDGSLSGPAGEPEAARPRTGPNPPRQGRFRLLQTVPGITRRWSACSSHGPNPMRARPPRGSAPWTSSRGRAAADATRRCPPRLPDPAGFAALVVTSANALRALRRPRRARRAIAACRSMPSATAPPRRPASSALPTSSAPAATLAISSRCSPRPASTARCFYPAARAARRRSRQGAGAARRHGDHRRRSTTWRRPTALSAAYARRARRRRHRRRPVLFAPHRRNLRRAHRRPRATAPALGMLCLSRGRCRAAARLPISCGWASPTTPARRR